MQNYIEIVGIVTLREYFNISYARDKGVRNYRYADFFIDSALRDIPKHILRGKMSDHEVVSFCERLEPEFIIVAGWYHMIPKIIRNIPRLGTAGFHASLLPYYRGGAPLVWAIINGETETGVSFFYFEDGVDEGDLIAQESVDIAYEDDIASLYAKVEEKSLKIISTTLPLITRGQNQRIKQKELPQDIKAKWPNRSPEDGLIDWNQPAKRIYDFVRAQTHPYPGAFTIDSNTGRKLTIWKSEVVDIAKRDKVFPGKILTRDENNRYLFSTNENDKAILVTCVSS
jgi:methionyl-tRNA formyltransferase